MKNSLKKFIYIYLFFLIILSIVTVIYAILIYSGKVNHEMRTFNIWTFIIGIFCFLFLGFFSANVAQKNGLLEGLVSALIIIFVTLLINLILKVDFNFKTFVKIVTYILAASFGGVIGVNFKPLIKRFK